MRAVLVALALLIATPASAALPGEMLPDPAMEARARVLSKNLRCMVCQNQSIDDSDAPLARDLRVLVRDRLKAGDSDNEVIDYLVSRYGEFVLLTPRLGWHTALLWGAPIVALFGGALFIFGQSRRRRPLPPSATAALTEDEKQRLDTVMKS